MNRWDERYSAEDYAYGTEPNDFLAAHVHMLPKGRVLSLAEGEGRNAVFLAAQGYKVTAVDQSAVGLAKARRLAEEKGVAIETIEADLGDFDIEPQSWDAIVSISAHVPKSIRQGLHRRVVEGLKPGGVLLLEAYTPRQLETAGKGGPGPDQRDRFMTLADLHEELDGLDFKIARETERDVNEGKYHSGPGAVVQILARKP